MPNIKSTTKISKSRIGKFSNQHICALAHQDFFNQSPIP